MMEGHCLRQMSRVGKRVGLGILKTRSDLRGSVSQTEVLQLSPGDSGGAEGVSTGGYAQAGMLPCPYGGGVRGSA